ncbi:MAG: pilus assembly protein TadB [Bacillota bacterium]|nr:pilus assembly protein TadB [Bacillota bacterium]
MVVILICGSVTILIVILKLLLDRKSEITHDKKHGTKLQNPINTQVINYNEYNFSKIERLKIISISCALLFLTAYLFFRNIYFCLFLCTFSALAPRFVKRNLIEKRRQKLCVQFKDALYAVSSSLSAGKSAEGAFRDAVNDLRILYPDENCYIIKELELINRKIGMNEPISAVLGEFAARTDIEDIRNFSDVFAICKNTGGNLSEVVKSTYNVINQKLEVKSEIKVIISEQKLSQKVLNIVPFGLLLLLSSSSPDYVEPLYSPKGHLIMLIVLIFLVVAYLIGSKITDIEV